MASDNDDLAKALQQNLQIRRELGTELGKADGIQPAKHDPGVVYRLGWVLYWGCLVIAGAWAVFFLWWAWEDAGVIEDIHRSPYLAVLAAAPSVLLYGLGRAIRYVLAAE